MNNDDFLGEADTVAQNQDQAEPVTESGQAVSGPGGGRRRRTRKRTRKFRTRKSKRRHKRKTRKSRKY